MAERWYSWFAASGFASLFAYTEFVDSRFQHAGWPWPRRTIREVIPRRLWLPATRRRRRCPRCPSYTVTLAYKSLAGEKQLHVTGGGTARVRRWSTWRSEPRCRLCRCGIGISTETNDVLSGIAVIAIRMVASMLVPKMEVRVDGGAA